MQRTIALVFLATLLAASPSFAEDCSKDDKAKAKAHYNEGAKAFRIGELPKAANAFKAAYEACPSTLLLYNLGQTYRQLRDNEKALYFYKQYLSTSPPADERRADVQKLISQIEAQIVNQRRLQEAPPPGPAAPTTTAPTAAPVAATENTAPATASLTATERATPEKPLYKRWWLWTTVAAVAAVGVGVGLGVGLSQSAGTTTFPTVRF